MITSLYVRTPDDTGLDSVMSSVFSILGIKEQQKRFSDNYAGGEYITGMVLGLQINGCRADDSEFHDYHYWLMIRPKSGLRLMDEKSISGMRELVAQELANNGYSVALDMDAGKKNSRRVLFSRHS